MYDILEQVENFIDDPVEPDDQEIFDRITNFIIDIEPDSLTDDQIEEVMDILDQLEFKQDVIEQKKPGFKLASKSSVKKRQYTRKYYRRNRTKIKKKRVIFKRSAEGRKRKRLLKRMEKQRRTPTGRKKTRYHATRGGQGGKRQSTKEK